MSLFRNKQLFIFENKKSKLPYVTIACSLLLCFVFSGYAFAQNVVNSWYDNSTQEIQKFQEIYNDGTLKVTAQVDGNVSPATGDVSVAKNITLTNQSTTGYIRLNSVSAVCKEGFEDSNIENWSLKNSSQTLFEGGSSTQFVPDFKINKEASSSFKVSTTLTGQDAISLADTTPFSFVYDYDLVEPKIDYQVCIWGIEEDKVMDPTHVAGLSFGPACGEERTCLEVDCHDQHSAGKHCIHEDSWDEIIENCNTGNWDLYSECLVCGCTKTIPIKTNLDLFNPIRLTQDYVCSSLNFTTWNEYHWLNMWHDDESCEPACWETSRIRATYNGYDENGSNFTPSEFAYEGKINDCLTSKNCVLSCFPQNLSQAIKPKYYFVPKKWKLNDYKGEMTESVALIDKLWAPSIEEVWGDGGDVVAQNEFYEKQYSKMALHDVSWGNHTYTICYSELGLGSDVWTCSSSRRYNYNGWCLHASGRPLSNVKSAPTPFFCLGEKEIHLDNYSLEDLCDFSAKVKVLGKMSPVYYEFEAYMIKDEIWWSNSDGYFNEKGFDCSSVITNEDVSHCNQAYKNSFKKSDGTLAEDCNNFIFLRPIGIYDDYIWNSKTSTYDFQGITFQTIHALPQARQMGGSKGENWSSTGLRTWLNETAIKTFADAFKNSFKDTSIFYNSKRDSTTNIKSEINKLFVPSYSQSWAVNKDTSLDACGWYANGYNQYNRLIFKPNLSTGLISEAALYRWNYYQAIDGSSSNEKLKYLAFCNDGSNPDGYTEIGTWLRSGNCDMSSNYFCINSEGCFNSSLGLDKKLSVAPCFCL